MPKIAASAILGISIHAPPRGATRQLNAPIHAATDISIHAPPRGATRDAGTKREHEQFQFTPLREGRHRRHCG